MLTQTPNLTMSTTDRAGFTLFSSVLIHIVVIMGIGFTYEISDRVGSSTPSIQTTLVRESNESVESDLDTDLFAAASQEGGGLGQVDSRVTSPLPALNYPTTQAAQKIKQLQARQTAEQTLIYRNLPSALLIGAIEPADFEESQESELAESEQPAMLSSPLNAELDQQLNLGQQLTRQKFISSRTKEHKYASYMESWRSQVEQVGNLNYPEAARQRQLSGDLVLSVTINADGSVEQVEVIRSSGQKVLDDAAVRIVSMAAPFDPFPESILKEADQIHITRTWQFLHNSTLIQN